MAMQFLSFQAQRGISLYGKNAPPGYVEFTDRPLTLLKRVIIGRFNMQGRRVWILLELATYYFNEAKKRLA